MKNEPKCPFCASNLDVVELSCGRRNYGCRKCNIVGDERLWKRIFTLQKKVNKTMEALNIVGNGKADEQGICRFVDNIHCVSVRDLCRDTIKEIENMKEE